MKLTVANAFSRIMRTFPGMYVSQAMCLTADGPKFAVTFNQFGSTLEKSNLWKKSRFKQFIRENNGKVVFFVGAVLHKSFFCPGFSSLSFLFFCCPYNVIVTP